MVARIALERRGELMFGRLWVGVWCSWPLPIVGTMAGMTEPTPKRRRRWYQFSLRSLMLFMVVCAVGSAWVGSKLEATRREQVAVAEIEKFGGSVQYHEMKGPDWLDRIQTRTPLPLVPTSTCLGCQGSHAPWRFVVDDCPRG